MTQWLTIDTAFQDGRRVLLLVANPEDENSQVFARWKDGAWRDDRHMPLPKVPVGWRPSAAMKMPSDPLNSG